MIRRKKWNKKGKTITTTLPTLISTHPIMNIPGIYTYFCPLRTKKPQQLHLNVAYASFFVNPPISQNFLSPLNHHSQAQDQHHIQSNDAKGSSKYQIQKLFSVLGERPHTAHTACCNSGTWASRIKDEWGGLVVCVSAALELLFEWLVNGECVTSMQYVDVERGSLPFAEGETVRCMVDGPKRWRG